jgi:4-hydroxy-tetrahydrodipicolinate synthase
MNPKGAGNKYDRYYSTIVTPYKDNYEVDEQALRKFLKYFMQPAFINIGGGIIVNAQAGELDHLTREEKKRNIEIAMEECGGKVPVFSGVGGIRTEDVIKTALDVKEVGADGIMLFSPIGGAMAGWDPEMYPEVWLDFAKAVCNAVPNTPIIGHGVAGFHPLWGIGLPLNITVRTCKEIPAIMGWKMVYPLESHPIIAKALRKLDTHVGVFEAPGLYFHTSLSLGIVDGSVSGSWNYALEPMIEHIKAWQNKDIDEAGRIWHNGLENLHEYIYVPITRLHSKYKVSAWLRGLIPNPFMRPPLPRPRQAAVQAIKERLVNCGLNIIPEKDIKKVTAQLLP